MAFDLVVRNGLVVDGNGGPARRADVAVVGDRIAEIGDLSGQAASETINAEGHVVSPGFIDGHTHMDAQLFWDPLGTNSCWHGVTSVIMGNCGFTLAPCAAADADFVIRNLERAEDISPAAMKAGIPWTWETFPEYLDIIDRLPKGINYGVYMGHSALRTYVMRERAFSEEAGEEDLLEMRRHLKAGLAAGAAGFTTSRTSGHKTPDGGPVASRVAAWSEVRALVEVLGEARAGVFELAREDDSNDPEVLDEFIGRLQRLALETEAPTTFGVTSRRAFPDSWRKYARMVSDTAARGGRMLIQSHARAFSVLLSWETSTPFDRAPGWAEVRRQPLEVQLQIFRDPHRRAELVRSANSHSVNADEVAGAEPRQADFDSIFVLDGPFPPYRSVGSIARERGADPLEVMIHLALEKDFKQFFQQVLANEDEDNLLELIRHPQSVVTFSDSGAHVSQIMDSSLQTHLLGYWVRERQAIPLEAAIKKITADLADFWNLEGRGRIATGAIADLTIFDPDTIAPDTPQVAHDLPTGARRLTQTASGLLATVVGGRPLIRGKRHTGELPGRLLRARRAA